jgi:hypothetical protein
MQQWMCHKFSVPGVRFTNHSTMTTPTSSSKRLPVLMGMLAAGLFVLLSIYVDPPDDASRFHGNRTVLAVRVLLNDAAYNHTTQTGLSDDIFGNGRDPHNLRSQYEACSFGQLIFNKAPDRNMTKDPNDGTTAIANGVVDVKIDLSVTPGRDQISSALATKLVEVFGVPGGSGTPLADHVMVCMPGGIFDGAFSLVPLLRFVSFYSNEECSSVAMQMKMVRGS